ncbi:MAG: RluA family pseudouridine synthase [Butyrivibrio sp.]|nr:RluA family pseudouridine synthase [Butyrivibrio sp.]
MKPDIAYEDANIIICVKPQGMPSQSDRTFDADLLGAVRAYQMERGKTGDAFIINRLDKPVGGLVLFALNKKTASALSAMTGAHSIEKSYYAVVCGETKPKGSFTDWLLKEQKENLSKAVPEGTAGAKKASLAYETLASRRLEDGVCSLVRIRLFSGRHHQIRVQFAAHGHALYGDVKYNPVFAGRRGVLPALFAYMLSFNNPFGAERISVEIEPSGGIWQEFEGLY